MLDYARYKSLEEFRAAAYLHGISVPLPMCHGIEVAMKELGMSFAEVFSKFLEEDVIVPCGNTFLYDMKGHRKLLQSERSERVEKWLNVSTPVHQPTIDRVDVRVFEGYPYVITRVSPALFHFLLLPVDLEPKRLMEFTRRQLIFNRLPTCLVLGSESAIYYNPDGQITISDLVPAGAIYLSGKLQPCEVFRETAELKRRADELHTFLEITPQDGYLLGDLTKGGRPATAEEKARMTGRQRNGIPKGLTQCKSCLDWYGVCLDPNPEFEGKVMRVHCKCENWNWCARCGQPLADRRLNANYFDESNGHIRHVPGFTGLNHRCRQR